MLPVGVVLVQLQKTLENVEKRCRLRRVVDLRRKQTSLLREILDGRLRPRPHYEYFMIVIVEQNSVGIDANAVTLLPLRNTLDATNRAQSVIT